MPMSAMTLKSVRHTQSARKRADAGRRQRRDDRDRVDVALVEHAQHDVDGDDRGEDEQRLARQRLVERLRRAHEVRVHAGRHADARLRRRGSPFTASPSDSPGARLNEIVTAGNCPWWLIASGAVVVATWTIALSGTGDPLAARTKILSSAAAVFGLLGLHLEDDAVQVQLREDDRDLPLAERVVERVVDHLRRDAQPRRRVAVDRQRHLQARRLLVARDVLAGRAPCAARRRASAPRSRARSGRRPRACTGTACG